MHRSEYWPVMTAHQEHWERHNNPYVYEYDPTDEGPEQSVASIILSTHTLEEIATESIEHRVASKLYDTIALGLKDSGIIEAMRLRGVRI